MLVSLKTITHIHWIPKGICLTSYSIYLLLTLSFILGPSPCKYVYDRRAFIFSLYNLKGYNPFKLELKPGKEKYAVYHCGTSGPTFGDGNDLHIDDNAYTIKQSYTNCGHGYEYPPGYGTGMVCNILAGLDPGYHQFIPDDVEVFYEE